MVINVSKEQIIDALKLLAVAKRKLEALVK